MTSPMKSRMNAANDWRAAAVFHIKIGSWKHPLLFNLRPGGTKWGKPWGLVLPPNLTMRRENLDVRTALSVAGGLADTAKGHAAFRGCLASSPQAIAFLNPEAS